MLLKNALILACLLCMASCGLCPEDHSPTMSVTFRGDFNIRNVYGIGGGRIFHAERDTTAGVKNIMYKLELAVTRDTTAYIIEQEARKDTLVVYHTHEAHYESVCGFYITLKKLEVRFPATTFSKEKISNEGEHISITK